MWMDTVQYVCREISEGNKIIYNRSSSVCGSLEEGRSACALDLCCSSELGGTSSSRRKWYCDVIGQSNLTSWQKLVADFQGQESRLSSLAGQGKICY
jgi:hypothetical protein